MRFFNLQNKILLIIIPLMLVVFIFSAVVVSIIASQMPIQVKSEVDNLKVEIGNYDLLTKLLTSNNMIIADRNDLFDLLSNYIVKGKTRLIIVISQDDQKMVKTFYKLDNGTTKTYTSANIDVFENTIKITLYLDPSFYKLNKKQAIYSLNILFLQIFSAHLRTEKLYRMDVDLDNELKQLIQTYLPADEESVIKDKVFIYVK